MQWRPKIVGWEGNSLLEKMRSLLLEGLKVTFQESAHFVIVCKSLFRMLVVSNVQPPCWWFGWWLWRAGCILQDTYLLYVIHCRKRIYADLAVETIYLPEEKYLGWLGWRYNVFTLGKVLLLTWFRERQRSPIWWPWYRHRPGKSIWLRGPENHQNHLEQWSVLEKGLRPLVLAINVSKFLPASSCSKRLVGIRSIV